MRRFSIRGVVSSASTALLLITFLAANARAGGVITHYDIDAQIFPEQGKLGATAALTLTAPEGGLQQIRLLLNRSLEVRSVTSDAGIKSFSFDRTQPSNHRYAPTAAPLVVDFAEKVEAGRSIILRIGYEGAIEPDTWRTNLITPKWVELAFYVAWYPYDPGSSSFTSRVTVKTDPAYPVTGTGVLSRAENGWVLTQDQPSWDIIVISAPNLSLRRVGDQGAEVEVWYSTLTADQVDHIAGDAGKVLTQLKNWLGPVSSKKLRIVFAERDSGGGYYRTGFMTLIWDPEYPELVRYAAHEAAHFWWGRGRSTTWEDWLNESFAEYSALLLMRDWYGPAVFADYLSRYRKEAENAPAIWGLDRNDNAAYTVLYRKGPVLLEQLEQKIGSERFREFLALLVSRKVENTDQLLSTLEEVSSKEIRANFERTLKQ
jgi:hypothetical protein